MFESTLILVYLECSTLNWIFEILTIFHFSRHLPPVSLVPLFRLFECTWIFEFRVTLRKNPQRKFSACAFFFLICSFVWSVDDVFGYVRICSKAFGCTCIFNLIDCTWVFEFRVTFITCLANFLRVFDLSKRVNSHANYHRSCLTALRKTLQRKFSACAFFF